MYAVPGISINQRRLKVYGRPAGSAANTPPFQKRGENIVDFRIGPCKGTQNTAKLNSVGDLLFPVYFSNIYFFDYCSSALCPLTDVHCSPGKALPPPAAPSSEAFSLQLYPSGLFYVFPYLLCPVGTLVVAQCGSQRTAFRDWFSPSIVWFSGTERGSLGLAARTFAL